MLLASLALVVAVLGAVVVARAHREQRRLRRSLAGIRRGELVRSTAYAEADRAAAWLTTVTDPITKPITRPIAGATQSVAGSVAGVVGRLLPFGSRRTQPAVVAGDGVILAELGRGVDEAVFERRDLTADLADDETMSLGLVDDAG